MYSIVVIDDTKDSGSFHVKCRIWCLYSRRVIMCLTIAIRGRYPQDGV